MLGLAQLYQIRGRIGRSDAYAYAYLLYPSEDLLTERGRGAPDDAERPHRPRRRLQDRHGRPRDPRRRQPARRRAERARRRRRLRDVRADARGGGARAGRRAGGAHGAGARRPAGHRVRAAGLHRLRGDQDRRPPADRAGADGRRARRRARRARRPLRPAAGAGGEPHHAAGDQAQGGGARRDRRRLPRQPPAGRRARPGRRLGGARTNLDGRVQRTSRRTTCWRCIGRARNHRSSGGSRLRSMLYSPLVCLTTGRQPLGERIYEEAHRGCGPSRPRRARVAAGEDAEAGPRSPPAPSQPSGAAWSRRSSSTRSGSRPRHSTSPRRARRRSPRPGTAQYNQLKASIVNYLVQNQIIKQKASDMGVSVTDAAFAGPHEADRPAGRRPGEARQAAQAAERHPGSA